MSPTYERRRPFLRDFRRLPPPAQQEAFLATVERFVASLASGEFDPALRVKRVQRAADVWEITWAPDGRATFEYGAELHPGAARDLAPCRHPPGARQPIGAPTDVGRHAD